MLSVELDDEFDRVRSAICMSGLALSDDARSGVENVENVVNVKPRNFSMKSRRITLFLRQSLALRSRFDLLSSRSDRVYTGRGTVIHLKRKDGQIRQPSNRSILFHLFHFTRYSNLIDR